MYQRFIFAFGSVVICFIAAQAVAADNDLPYDFPRYAFEATCNATFMREGDDDIRRSKVQKCVEAEQQATDLLKSAWKDASFQIKTKCEEATKAGSYVSLYRCVSEQKRQEKLPLQIEPKASDTKVGTGSAANPMRR
jgi:hypothetical protein